MKNKIRQIIYDMRTQPVIAWVTVIGTALSIFLIMTVLMIQQVKIIPFAPEVHRGRMLYGIYLHVEYTDNQGGMSGGMAYETAAKLYGGLDGVEKTSYMQDGFMTVDVKGPANIKFSADNRNTDDVFWQVFEHPLVAGRYYTAAEVDAGRRVAVVTESVARRLFGSENPLGGHFLLDHNDFELVGVVADHSILADMAYGQVFSPISREAGRGDMFGNIMVALLPALDADPDAIRRQVKKRYAELDAVLAPMGRQTVYHGAPFGQDVIAAGVGGSNTTPDPSEGRTMRYAIYVIMLLVPAINLSSMLHSRMRRRIREIGVQRAFGCTRFRIVADIISENLIVTLMGGVIGLTAGILFALFYDGLYAAPGFVAMEAVHPSLSLLLNWRIITLAFGACFILNIISAAVPAWQASRLNPVEALNAK